MGHYVILVDPAKGLSGINAFDFEINFSVSSITVVQSTVALSCISDSMNSIKSTRLCDLAARYANASYPVSTSVLTRSSTLAVNSDVL